MTTNKNSTKARKEQLPFETTYYKSDKLAAFPKFRVHFVSREQRLKETFMFESAQDCIVAGVLSFASAHSNLFDAPIYGLDKGGKFEGSRPADFHDFSRYQRMIMTRQLEFILPFASGTNPTARLVDTLTVNLALQCGSLTIEKHMQ
ncbi:hypothetical protein [Glutamicibacter ardleyensis]|uniref:hypothetical protein n=1 Tax=Glutamicibacter ardleyensis TaxID=225894 RepID=UPI003FCFCDAB